MGKMKITLEQDEKIIAAIPEYYSSPGWTNMPIWVTIVNFQKNTFRQECIQPSEQTKEMNVLFKVCNSAHNAMMGAVNALVVREKNE